MSQGGARSSQAVEKWLFKQQVQSGGCQSSDRRQEFPRKTLNKQIQTRNLIVALNVDIQEGHQYCQKRKEKAYAGYQARN